ncbi:MAG: DUF2785 domain-containing protein [Defluviitaleaceae bacterium]|nr:DUF2785 domain-containing protein [Defluviitaleaceae bacterium]
MRTCEELRQQLVQIKENNWKVPEDVDLDALITDMLRFIGHTDGELRDGLIYLAFCEFTEGDTLTETQIRHILFTCLDDNHLFHGIGEGDTDTVFTRSFSALGISVALYTQYERPFLSAKELSDIKDCVLNYITLEKDFRGYVEGKGWAHSIAHIADVLAHMVCFDNIDDNETVGRDAMLAILDAVKLMACNATVAYDSGEDERLAVVFVDACDSEVLTQVELTGWLDSVNNAEPPEKPAGNRFHTNRRNLLRSIYFQLLENGDHEEICKHLLGFFVKSDE